jgi:hypothetical protein
VKFIAWIELKLYREVLLMVAISVLFWVTAAICEALGMTGNLAGAAGGLIGILWKLFALYVFLKLLRRKPHCNCGNAWNAQRELLSSVRRKASLSCPTV